MACYTFGIIVWNFIIFVNDDSAQYWIMYLSQWLLIISDLYFICSSFLTSYLIKYIGAHVDFPELIRPPNLNNLESIKDNKILLLMKITKILIVCALVVETLVVTVYWTLIYPFDEVTQIGKLLNEINVHGIVGLLVYIDYFSSTLIIMYQNALYVIAFGVIYILWSLIFSLLHLTALDGNAYLYAFLDWRSNPLTAFIYTLAFLIIVIVIHFILSCIKFKILLNWTYRNNSNKMTQHIGIRSNLELVNI